MKNQIDISTIDCSKIRPDHKDIERARGLHIPGQSINNQASRMAKAIKDPLKLARRALAVLSIWGERHSFDSTLDTWTPFGQALLRMGFSHGQIHDLRNIKLPTDRIL